MKSYGKFEAVREMYLTPFAAIWAARPVGTDGPPGACVKLIQPESPIFAGKGAAAAEELLVSAALQQSIANKSEHWAPIYELGYDGDSAFYVTKIFDRSLKKLVDSKTKFTSAELLTIISAIVEGLIDLRTAFNRSHANLKPANVLIAGKGRIHREDVRLIDPHSGDQETASMSRPPDVKAVGEIIFALVTSRPHTSARWPVEESVEWNRLGSSGAQWLTLCNDLLNTMARQGPMSLPKIQARLGAIRTSRPRIPRLWFAAAAVIACLGCGYVFRAKLKPAMDAGKQWAGSLKQHPVSPQARLPDAQPQPIVPAPTQVVIAPPPVIVSKIDPPVVPIIPVPAPIPVPPPVVAPVPVVTPAPVVVPPVVVPPVVTPAPVVAPPVVAPPIATPAPVVVPPPVVAQAPTPAPLPVVQLPRFLPPTAAAKFLETVSNLSSPATADQRAKFVDAINPLDDAYPSAAIHGDRPWQIELAKYADSRREIELTAAVQALANSGKPDPSAYIKFKDAAQAFNTEATSSEDAINTGASWVPPTSQANIQKTLHDQESLLDDGKERTTAAPPVLDEMRPINSAITSGNPQGLLTVLHDQSSSLPARVAAWQALDLPVMHGQWPAGRTEYVAGQKDGDALGAASAGTGINIKTAITDYQDRRLHAFYATLTTDAALTDAIPHLIEIEDGHGDQRPNWLEFDRIVYLLKQSPVNPADADLQKLQSLTNSMSAAANLNSALEKAKNAATSDEPLKGAGPGVLDWSTRPYTVSGLEGCVYTTEKCPSLEFIRVEPGPGKGFPFYLSSTVVPVGLVSALLADPAESPAAASEALHTLNPLSQASTTGARIWKFSEGKGIELDPASYLQYFQQAPTADLPMQQITPQAAMFIARDLGCRLPTSTEWKAALAMAMNPPAGNDPMKGFATVGWKLRDADFQGLVDAAAKSQHFPDDGIFLGDDSSHIAKGSAATAWPPSTIRKLGGWTVDDLKNDRDGQRQMARLDENSSDFRSDLVEPAQKCFRPVGTTHHVFHDLIGNVAEFVLTSAGNDVESLPTGTKITSQKISDWFSAIDHMKQVRVVGGSYLSPPELDPMTAAALPAGVAYPAFTDVGFRLAFTDPKAFADVSMVIRSAAYLYAPPAAIPVDTTR